MSSPRRLADKRSHIDVCADPRESDCGRGAGFERYRLPHLPLPEIDLQEIDTSVELFGRRLAAPLFVAPMSGGIEEGSSLLRACAETAGETGIGIAVGSQRIALERPELARGFTVREVAPDALVFANLGAVNLLTGRGADDCRRAVEMIEADALMLHCNPIQEAIQGGDTRFGGLIGRIAEICSELAKDGIPVVVREVGFGMPAETASAVLTAGAAGVDTGGSGGTSWALVEGRIAEDPVLQRAGETFRDWGLTTTESLEQLAAYSERGVILATGGIRTGVDVAKALALGGRACGVAAPFLRAYLDAGRAGTDLLARQLIFELRLAMFGCGAADVDALRLDSGNLRQPGA